MLNMERVIRCKNLTAMADRRGAAIIVRNVNDV